MLFIFLNVSKKKVFILKNLVCNQLDYFYNFNFVTSNLCLSMKMYREMGRSAYYLFSFFIFKFFYVEKVEGSIMNRKVKKFVIIKITQIIIFCISIIAAILYRNISPSWPFYLLLIGILLGLLIPINYRSGFSSKEPGFILKSYTRGTENLIEFILDCIAIVIVWGLNLF